MVFTMVLPFFNHQIGEKEKQQGLADKLKEISLLGLKLNNQILVKKKLL
jgi:hypothetical protein